MRKFFALVFLLPLSYILANGVAIVNAHNPTYLRLDSTSVKVIVVGQISKTITTQYYTNTGPEAQVKYGFPLSEQASAIQLRWEVDSLWHTASVSGTKQDTTLPGEGTPAAALISYLGNTPLYFLIPQTVKANSSLIVELTYVEFLPYSFGKVNYVYPSDYHLIQSSAIEVQRLNFVLTSQRSIDSINVISSHNAAYLKNSGDSAEVEIALFQTAGTENYAIQYSLNAAELGLFAYSTKLSDSLAVDSLGKGFLTFIAEPDPSSTLTTIPKVFTLIIDRSGSMSGTKIEQAKAAAAYIVQNLNEVDEFNLIDFDDVITSFRPGHVPFTVQTRDSALTYINSLYARNNTSISGAFDTAVPQFASADNNSANIIIFLTDGQPTAGITDMNQLVQHIDNLVTTSEKNIFVFCFGIGSDVNKPLLSQISLQNKGIAEFLENDELYSRITDFYLEIRNPVLLNSHIEFSPPVVTEVYPDSLPNLYKGKQMIVAGRYSNAQPVQITLSGTAFGRAVSYSYNVQLNEASNSDYQFLPKVWAKRKIESLLVHYYSIQSSSTEADSIKNIIIELSKAYGIITTFTSFSSPTTEVKGKAGIEKSIPSSFELLGNYPNPFNPSTTIRVKINTNIDGTFEIRIYNILGQVVRRLLFKVRGQGIYNVNWDGLDEKGNSLTSGIYFYGVEISNKILVNKMILIK